MSYNSYYLLSRDGDAIVCKGSGEIIKIEPWAEDVLRFRSTISGSIIEENWTLIGPLSTHHIDISIDVDRAHIRCGRLAAVVSGDGVVKYYGDDKLLLEELWIDYRVNNANLLKARNYKHLHGNLYRIELYFRAYDDEYIYGMGQYATGYLNLKGCTLELAHRNTQISIPFTLIARPNDGVFYGFIWNNPCIGRATFAKNMTLWMCEASKQIDYLIIYGSSPAEIVKKYFEIFGKPPLLPEWAFGFWQSKLRYRSQDELLNVAHEYKGRGLPLSVIVIDFFHWPNQGDWKFDSRYWPDPRRMVEELEKLGVKVMVSVWPTVDTSSENYNEMVRRNLLVRTEKGIPLLHTFRGLTTYVDFTNPEARAYIWNKVKDGYYRYGIKLFWLDVAEPEFGWGFGYFNILPYHYENVRYFLGNGLETSNLYPFYYAKAFYDGLVSEGEKEFALLIRAAWLGSHRYPIIVWSGDIPSTFDSLKKQVKAGLNMAVCGVVYWTTDIGGFYGGDPNDPEFRELIIRWFQFGVFCPIFRLHGYRKPYPKDASTCDVYELTGGPNEVWSFGDEAYQIIKNLLFLRELLKPYIIEQARKASEEGLPIIRPLFFDFPHDLNTYSVEDEYMFGSEILVAPILEKGVLQRRIYLPRDVEWIDVNTDDKYTGGQWIEYKVSLDTIPVFVKDYRIYRIFKEWKMRCKS